jgi:hypothetical protein
MTAIDPANLGADTLKGIVMRAPGVAATKEFYLENWGLAVAAEQDGTVYFRGTGPEPFIYGLREDPTFGIDYIHFGMVHRARLEALHAKLAARGVPVIEPLGPSPAPGGGHSFMIRASQAPQGLACSAEHARHGADAGVLCGQSRLPHE